MWENTNNASPPERSGEHAATLRICELFFLRLQFFSPTNKNVMEIKLNALLLGSIGLFVILGAIMYFSQKIKWYSNPTDS
jgi:inner membrane protein involved in colicin E2 resistance